MSASVKLFMRLLFNLRNLSRHGLFYLVLALASTGVSAKSKLAIGQDVYERMQEAQVFIEAKDYDQAGDLLDELASKKRLNNYEKAQILSMKGNLAYQQEQVDAALENFKKASSYSNLPEGFLQATLRTLAQLSFMQDHLDDALLYAKQLMDAVEEPDDFTHILMAQIYYKKEQFDPALEHIQKAIAIQRGQGNQPQENWLLILNAIYYAKSDYQSMIGVLKELIALYPKQQYVTNLAAIYGQLEQTDKQLLLLEPLYDQGRLKSETELVNLANLMVLYKVPYKAAKIIEAGFESGAVSRNKRNLELLAQSWQLAAEQDKSVHYLAEAAKLEGDGITYFRLAQNYIGLYQWKNAEQALQEALATDDLEDKRADAWLLLGMVRFYSKDYRTARKAFKEASSFEGMGKLASQWMNFMDQEREKQAAADIH